jgi:hypothetical protein
VHRPHTFLRNIGYLLWGRFRGFFRFAHKSSGTNPSRVGGTVGTTAGILPHNFPPERSRRAGHHTPFDCTRLTCTARTPALAGGARGRKCTLAPLPKGYDTCTALRMRCRCVRARETV